MLTRRTLLAALSASIASRPGIARAELANLRQLLARRRMVRRFRSDPVADEVVERLLDAATRAPSAGNRQPWAFVVVRNPKKRKELGRAALGQMWLADAPVSIVACADRPRSRQRYGERGDRYALIDTAFASLLLLLAVTEEGLGACFVGAFDDAEVARLLKLPSDVQPLAIIPVGHPAETPKPASRRRLADVVHRESW